MSGRKRSNSGGRPAKAAKSGTMKDRSNKRSRRKAKTQYSATWTVNPSRGFGQLGPDKLRTRLRYCQSNQTLTCTTGVPTVRQYRLNSLFDPDFTGVGHQPYGFDQIVLMGYQAYCVYGVKYKILLEQQIADIVQTGGFDVFAESTSVGLATIPSDLQTPIERGARFMRNYSQQISSNTNSDTPTYCSQNKMSRFIKMKHLYGRKVDEIGDGAAVNTNPSTGANLFLYMLNHRLQPTMTRYVTIIMDFYCEFFRGQTVAAS